MTCGTQAAQLKRDGQRTLPKKLWLSERIGRLAPAVSDWVLFSAFLGAAAPALRHASRASRLSI